MKKVLNITNGDCAVDIMKQAGVPGDILPWQDVLHDGPVPDGLSLVALSEVRAEFIVKQGWADLYQIRSLFFERDRMLHNWRDYSKVILWFEHDLYDQLQILQILDWFSEQTIAPGQLTMICTENYLGMQKPEEINLLVESEHEVTRQHLLTAKNAWKAFRSETPEAWAKLLQMDTSILPFLHDNVIRLLEEYPSIENGLSRTQYHALRIVADNEISLGRLFAKYQETEQRRFLGDLSFWQLLQQMIDSTPPLLKASDGEKYLPRENPKQKIKITRHGLDVLDGNSNWLTFHKIDRWIGGVYLNPDNLWFWNSKSGTLKRGNL